MGVHHRRPDHKLLQEYAFCVYICLVLCCVLDLRYLYCLSPSIQCSALMKVSSQK